jgi:hypothetical protein
MRVCTYGYLTGDSTPELSVRRHREDGAAGAAGQVAERVEQQEPETEGLAAHSVATHSPSVFDPPVLGSCPSPEEGSDRRATPVPSTLDWVVTAVQEATKMPLPQHWKLGAGQENVLWGSAPTLQRQVNSETEAEGYEQRNF